MSHTEPEPKGEVTEEIADKPRGGRGGCVVGCLFLGIVFYLLSPPMVGLVLMQMIEFGWQSGAEAAEKTVTVLYVPIQWLYDNVSPARAFYDWYFGLFEAWFDR